MEYALPRKYAIPDSLCKIFFKKMFQPALKAASPQRIVEIMLFWRQSRNLPDDPKALLKILKQKGDKHFFDVILSTFFVTPIALSGLFLDLGLEGALNIIVKVVLGLIAAENLLYYVNHPRLKAGSRDSLAGFGEHLHS